MIERIIKRKDCVSKRVEENVWEMFERMRMLKRMLRGNEKQLRRNKSVFSKSVSKELFERIDDMLRKMKVHFQKTCV